MYNKRLKYLREEKEITQVQISKLLGFKDNVYSQFEKNKTTLPIKHLNTLCNYFNVSFDYIFEFTNIKKYKNSNNDIDIKLSGKRLKDFRKENKLTQLKLAKILNLDNSMIGKYEKGQYVIATTYLYQICKKYHISADYLLGKTNEPKYLK